MRSAATRFVLAAVLALTTVTAAQAQTKTAPSEDVLRQRLLLKEKFNKGWDAQLENAGDRIEAKCKAEARRHFSMVHPIKRRRFVKDCMASKRR